MFESLESLGARAVEDARTLGASDAFVAVSRSANTEIQRRDGKTERLVESVSRSMSVQLWVDGRYSAQSTTDLRPEAITAFLKDAIALTRALEPDPHRVITDPSLYPTSLPALDIDDPALEKGMSPADREAWVAELEASARGHERVISVTSNLSYNRSLGVCVTSNGFRGRNVGTSVWPSVEVTLRDSGDKRASDGDYAGSRFLARLPPPASIGKQALSMAVLRLGSTAGPTTRTTMVVDPRVSASLIGRLLRPATANSIQQGRSFWSGKLGSKLLSDKLSIVDRPTLPQGLASRPFDGEGIAARDLPLVEAGVLKNVYVDTYYGRKAGMTPNTGSPSNRVVGLGERDLAGWLGAVGKGVLVTSWLGGNADANTGDFSFGIRGHLFEGGQIGAPVSEMNVTGNLTTLFASLAGTGNDPWVHGSTLCPTLVFEGVQFSGA